MNESFFMKNFLFYIRMKLCPILCYYSPVVLLSGTQYGTRDS